MIKRFSSRRNLLTGAFLNERLRRAERYDRIAGYFRSSIFEVAGEAFEAVPGPIRIVCNTSLDERDIRTAQGQKIEFYAGNPLEAARSSPERYRRLAEMLKSRKVEVRVLPDKHFGLIHGKAGVITFAGGAQTCFLGSINETREAWSRHYELLWEDDDPAAVKWVQEEFDALWTHASAQQLSDAVMMEVDRILRRHVVAVSEWNPTEETSAPFSEAAIHREGPGLMPHQKYFVITVAREIKTFGEARFLLADEVGLGKTIQLAMAAEMIALTDTRPVLILCPKNLGKQWQEEMHRMLGVPAARWDGGAQRWVTEAGVEYPGPITECPRRIGIVSTSLITADVSYIQDLLKIDYSCVILDEAHRARFVRAPGRQPEPNNLMAFLRKLAGRTKTLLLGTATPVQLDRMELFDLMELLQTGCDRVLGGVGSPWRKADEALDMVAGIGEDPQTAANAWNWFRNPIPPDWEMDSSRTIQRIWEELDVMEGARFDRGRWRAQPNCIDKFSHALRDRLVRDFRYLVENHNPFIRHTIKRTREQLTKPASGALPYFKQVQVVPDDLAVAMPPDMERAYGLARDFSRSITRRRPRLGILNTLLLRRIGSSLIAGEKTAIKILGGDPDLADEEDSELVSGWDLDAKERDLLERTIRAIRQAGDNDPKLLKVVEHLRDRRWLDKGCIVFSQYYDSVWWLAKHLSRLFSEMDVGVYGGGAKCFLLRGGAEEPASREQLKEMVQTRKLMLLIATDAASEGLNLQKLETLINLDLPWNPARLEQRKGRINRIGQTADSIFLLNLRYGGSVEDDVHNRLSDRLRQIHQIFGTLPDMLEDVWIKAALEDIDAAQHEIDRTPTRHPFNIRYNAMDADAGWDDCASVLNRTELIASLQRSWKR